MPRPVLLLLCVLVAAFGSHVFGVDLPCASDHECSPTSVCRSGLCTIDDGALDAGGDADDAETEDAGLPDAGLPDVGLPDAGSIAIEGHCSAIGHS